jgi:heme/copper-type cytochrome/quinol oxidase subunit 4
MQLQNEEKLRWGKMFTMFGVIFTVILLICSYFLKGTLPG